MSICNTCLMTGPSSHPTTLPDRRYSNGQFLQYKQRGDLNTGWYSCRGVYNLWGTRWVGWGEVG